MEIRELVFMDAKSSKFWRIERKGKSHKVTYGRTGTSGQTKTKEFPTPDKAKKEFDKLVASKMAKGYVDGDGGQDDEDGSLPFIAFSSVKKHDDITKNVKTFAGVKVADYNPKKRPTPGGKTIYRFRSDWENDVLLPNLDHFLESDAAEEARGIVIGHWGGEDSDGSPDEIIQRLCSNSSRLPNLVALYLGDITYRENEMSWINQDDVSPLLKAFPNLQLLRTRGGTDLQIKKPNHANLRALAMETGGMPVEVVRSIGKSKFPNLEYLELWLGTEDYGGTSSVRDLQPILSGKRFPKLRYLGLRNCQYADDIAAVVVNSPLVERIETLDLSFGILTDEGARALLTLSGDGPLKSVNLHYNYFSKPMIKELKAHAVSFDTSAPKNMEQDEEWRYVAVGE